VAISAGALLFFSARAAIAKDIGYDPPKCPVCPLCSACLGAQAQEPSDTGTTISRSEGNLSERVNIANTSGLISAPTSFSAIYNSYNADMSRAQVDTVMGYGWTHSHNIFLFSQVGSMFRFDGDGRVTRYKLGPGGTFTAAPGYFETLVKNPDGSFTLTQKDKTTYTFKLIVGTPFLVVGPVYRVTSIVDRHGNTTTYTYAGGNLTAVTDTFGRSLTFSYATFGSSNRKLAAVTDPAGRVTTFQYDATGRKLTTIIDPAGKTTQYTYNTLYQLTSKEDKDGRVFTYSYAASEPRSVNDSSGASTAQLSNPGNWATDGTQLAMNQARVYIPSTTSKTDGRGNVWQYDYNANAQITRITAPDGTLTRYTYDPATLLLASTTDARGNTTTFTYDAVGNRTSTTDALGHVTSYTYEPTFSMVTGITDARGRVTTFTVDPVTGDRLSETDPLGQTRSWTYDSHGNVTSATDKNGHATHNTYDALGNLVQITDALGDTTSMTYDAVGNRLSRTDANGHTTSNTYDALNRQITETDATGHVALTSYDGESNRLQIVDRNGHTTTFEYDLRLRLIKQADNVGNVDVFAYDGNDNRVSLTDRNGHTTVSQYDVQNRVTRTTDALGLVATTAYDATGNVISRTDPNGHTTTFAYDALNRRASQTDALGDLTQTAYDAGTLPGCPACGATPGSRLVTSRTDANGKVAYLKYDALDRLIRVVRKVGSTADTITTSDSVMSYTYDPVGNQIAVTEPNGNTTTIVFDAINRKTTMTNAAGDVTRWAYDGVGNVVNKTAPNGNVTVITYDPLNRRTMATDSVGAVDSDAYDPVGNRLSHADGNGNTTTYAYDTLNRLLTTTDPLGQSTALQYDAVGNLLQRVDRNGHVSTYAYDVINRRVTETDALGHVTTFAYDGVGNRVSLVDANGHATLYQYDAIDRLTKETYADGRARSFTYDGVGNVLTRTDQIGQVTTYTYNDLYFVVARSYPSLVNDAFTYDLSGRMLSGLRGTWLVTFAYDGANRITSTSQNGRTLAYSYNIPGRTRTMTYPGGRSIVEHTDLRTRLDQIDDALAPPPVARYTYDAGDRITTRVYRNDTTASYTYNANDWTTTVAHAGVGLIAQFAYDYDHGGNKTFEEKGHLPTASEAYQYDAVDRLITYKVGTLAGSTVPVPATQTAYALDPVGNWSSKATDAITQTRVHDAVNELVQIDATPLTYDANGNAFTDADFTYVHDEENRLVRVVRKSDSAIVGQYQYDALGRRVARVVSPTAIPATILYFHDGARVVEEQDGGGATQATYVYGTYVDEVLTMDRGSQTYYYHQNALWSVEAITDSTATVVERYAYDAYGFPAITNGAGVPVPPNSWRTPHSAIGNPDLFTGRQLDEESGLYFYRARYYDPVKGRFLQRDPMEYSNRINLYAYVGDKPTRLGDPTGRVDEELWRRFWQLWSEWFENQGEFNSFERELVEKELKELAEEISRQREADKRLLDLYDELMGPEETGSAGATGETGAGTAEAGASGGRVAAAAPAAAGGVFGALYWWLVNKLLESQINSIVESTKSPTDGSGCCECECIHPDLSKPPAVRDKYFGVTEDIGRASGPTQCAILCIRATPSGEPVWKFHRCIY
jgi:RHS repeat-associated protein